MTSLLPSFTMRDDEAIQQLPDPIRKVIIGSSDDSSADVSTDVTLKLKKSEEEDLIKDLNPAVQIGLAKASSVKNLIGRFEKVNNTSENMLASSADVIRKPVQPIKPDLKQEISKDVQQPKPIQKIDTRQDIKEVSAPVVQRPSLRDLIKNFISNDEDYILHLGRILPECYQKPIQQFRVKNDKRGGENEQSYMLLDVLFNKLCKQMATEPTHLALYNLRKMIGNEKSNIVLSKDIKFLNAMSELIMNFVKVVLCKRYIPYVGEYISIRPKIQLLLSDNNKALQTFIRTELDKASEQIQKQDKNLIRVMSLEEMIAEPCKRLTLYLTTFRDSWLPYFKEAENLLTSTEEKELARQAADKFENACTKLEREMQNNFNLLERAFQMNSVYAIQKRLNMDSLSSGTTDVSQANNNKNAKANPFGAISTQRSNALPNFVYESLNESEYIYRLDKNRKRKNDYPCEAYLFENMFILSWINTKENNKRENKIYYLKGCAVEPNGEKIFVMTILGEKKKIFECKTTTAKQRWVACIRSVSETGFFSKETSRKLAQHIRKSSGTVDSVQDYYAVPIDDLYKNPQLWTCFEQGDEYNILYEKTDGTKKGNIRAASLEKLVQILTSPDKVDNSFLFSFMMTYQSFTSSEELLDLLINRYNIPPPKNILKDKDQFAKFKENVLFPRRIRICQVLKHWIQYHGYIFRNDPRARTKMSRFIEQHIAKTQLFTLADELRDDLDHYTQKRDTFAEQQLKMLSQKVQDMQLATPTTGHFNKQNNMHAGLEAPKPKLLRNSPIKGFAKNRGKSIMDWSSVEIARQLTLIEFALFENIQVKEFLNENWTNPSMAPNINAIIQRSNLVVFFVAHEILKQTSMSSRVHAIQKWIKVARECRKINNFNACREIVGGLRTLSISRLSQTWNKVDSKLKKEFEELKDLVAQKKNYKAMRSAMSSSAPPCLPYVGITLQDLTFINEGNQDLIPNTNPKPSPENPYAPYKPQLINFFKRQKIGVVISALQQYQRTSYVFICVPELANRLQNMVVLPEEKLIEMSLAAEPQGN